MSALARIHELEKSGITLEAKGGQLYWRAPVGRMTPDVMDWLREHKRELLPALTVRRTWSITTPGRPTFTLLAPNGCTHMEAERLARAKWHGAKVTSPTENDTWAR